MFKNIFKSKKPSQSPTQCFKDYSNIVNLIEKTEKWFQLEGEIYFEKIYKRKRYSQGDDCERTTVTLINQFLNDPKVQKQLYEFIMSELNEKLVSVKHDIIDIVEDDEDFKLAKRKKKLEDIK